MTTQDATGFDPDALARQTHAATEIVKALLATGQLTAEALGINVAELTAPASPPPADADGPSRQIVPGERITVHDLVVKTREGLTPGTERTYGTYLRFIDEGWPAKAPAEEKLFAGYGEKWADEVLPSQLEKALTSVTARALVQAHWRAENRAAAGRAVRFSDAGGARYNAVGAWRRMYKVAVMDRHLAKGFDPSQEIDKPKRIDGDRLALTQKQLDEVAAIITGTGDDPELDELINEVILVAGARAEGITNLTLGGIDRERCTLRLIEKGRDGKKKVVDQPVPDWLVEKAYAFAVARGAEHRDDQVFRYRRNGRRHGKPITDRRLDNVFADRVQAMLPWADKDQVTAHTMRHHAISVIERRFSKAVSLAFARHEPEDVNDMYSKATPAEVAHAVVTLYGGSHPWAK